MHAYFIRLRGQVAVDEVNEMSPQQMSAIHVDPGATLVSIYTDQSGLIGLLRKLHSLGIEILSVSLEPETLPYLSEK